MINRVSSYKEALKLFVEYLNDKSINPSDFFTKLKTRIQYIIVCEWSLYEYDIIVSKYKDICILKLNTPVKYIPMSIVYTTVTLDINNLEESYKVIMAGIFNLINELSLLTSTHEQEIPF